VLAVIGLGVPVGGAQAATAIQAPSLEWTACADGFECANALVPRDYANPNGPKLRLAVTRLPAQDQEHRIGSLFVNFGGPGGDAVATLQAIGKDLFASLNERFDIVGFDPRGTGESESAINCKVNQETLGLYAQPFTTPENLNVRVWIARAQRLVNACVSRNRSILPYVATASVARDMDLLRRAVGDRKLSYLGFSYGTFLGATYASLFPTRYRAPVLDGALDADQYINRPMESLLQQSAGFERALGRFFQACAANQEACLGFGGDDPHRAFDDLVAQADVNPIPAFGDDPRAVDGEDMLSAAILGMYAKQLWPLLAEALAEAQSGDATVLRFIADVSYGWLPDGTYDPAADRYFTLSAAEQRYTSDVSTFRKAGRNSWGLFDHFWWNSGYVELPLGLFPIQARGIFYGPFHASRQAPTILVVGTTYDPATPYRGAKRLVAELGNALLLTMKGDGHTAYGGNSACIDAAVDAYFVVGTLPAPGTVCAQEVPFEQPQPESARRGSSLSSLRADPNVVRALR
jgi:pimeloyl-ACP methyl ester carboxylesterase